MTKKRIILVLFVILSLNLLFINTVFAASGNIKNLKAVINTEGGRSTADVSLNYNLKIYENTREIPLKGLAFSETKINNLKASYEGIGLEVDLDQSNLPGFSGMVYLPEDQTIPEDITLVLQYQITKAVNFENDKFLLEAPLVVVNWKPLKAGPGVFESETTIPGEISIEEQFPTTPRTVTNSGSKTQVAIGLQTLPSLVRLSGRKGESVFLTYGRKVDLLVLLILVVGAYYGFKVLKKSKEE